MPTNPVRGILNA